MLGEVENGDRSFSCYASGPNQKDLSVVVINGKKSVGVALDWGDAGRFLNICLQAIDATAAGQCRTLGKFDSHLSINDPELGIKRAYQIIVESAMEGCAKISAISAEYSYKTRSWTRMDTAQFYFRVEDRPKLEAILDRASTTMGFDKTRGGGAWGGAAPAVAKIEKTEITFAKFQGYAGEFTGTNADGTATTFDYDPMALEVLNSEGQKIKIDDLVPGQIYIIQWRKGLTGKKKAFRIEPAPNRR